MHFDWFFYKSFKDKTSEKYGVSGILNVIKFW
jgi:hypothetical protein